MCISCTPALPCLLALLAAPFSKFAGFFQKVLAALGGEHIFQTKFKQFASKIHLFDPQAALMRTIFIACAPSCRTIARSLRSLFAPGPLQKTPVDRVPCTFRLQGPVYINDCMHHTFNFLNFVCYLLSSSCLQCSTPMFFVHCLLILKKFASRPRWRA